MPSPQVYRCCPRHAASAARVSAVLEFYLHPIPRQHTIPEALLAQLFHPPQKDIVVVRVMVGDRQELHVRQLRHLERLLITAVASALLHFEFLRGVLGLVHQ